MSAVSLLAEAALLREIVRRYANLVPRSDASFVESLAVLRQELGGMESRVSEAFPGESSFSLGVWLVIVALGQMADENPDDERDASMLVAGAWEVLRAAVQNEAFAKSWSGGAVRRSPAAGFAAGMLRMLFGSETFPGELPLGLFAPAQQEFADGAHVRVLIGPLAGETAEVLLSWTRLGARWYRVKCLSTSVSVPVHAEGLRGVK